jgi:beta-phosphoglucomutase-like phosphatase (HAD superfamily)
MKPTQEQALREYLREAIIPLIEDVLVKKIGQGMTFAAEELKRSKKEWQGLTDEEYEAMAEKYVTNYFFDTLKYARAIEAKLKEKNT